MSGMYMSEWPMFGTKDPNLGSSTDLLFDRDFIFVAFATCLIQGGYPVGATFERTGDVVTTGVTFGPNEPITLGGKYYHHGQVTDTIPAYDVSPLVRPTAPDVYDTAASQPNPDKHGLNWEFSDPKNGWVWDLLDGRADGVELAEDGDIPAGTTKWIPSAGWSITPGFLVSDGSQVTFSKVFQAITLDVGSRYEICADFTVEANAVRLLFDGTTVSGVYKADDGRRCERVTAIASSGEIGARSQPGYTGTCTNISVQKLVPATGTLNLKSMSVVPAVTEWQTTGDFNILSGATGNQILYIESGTGLICATDGTNTTKSVQPYVAGQDHTVYLAFGDSKMQIYVDGVNGTQVPFVGTFTPGETLKWGLNNEDIFSIGNVCGQTTSSFSESVHLAEELAYDL